ncbi:hypothetical protein [Chryseobacterium sp.]|uniref:hypothetical protein n=1 Tax=Chryseobacterium sp. TaxID=1871047 RepID=UPI0028982C03|nr:hypothetical protein [Chryseobacterium sp.]
MGDFHKNRNIRLINNVIAHEVGHLIANLLLNKVQDQPKAEEITLIWNEQFQRPGGQIDYSIKEGSKYWTFPKDLNLCYYTILSLYSGCIWEKFFDSIYHKKNLNINEIETCYTTSGFKDLSEISSINNLHLHQVLTKEFTREHIIKPYIELLQNLSWELKQKLYNCLNILASEVESHFYNTKEELKFTIKDKDFEDLKNFITNEFLIHSEKELNEIINQIRKFIKLE